MKQTSFIPGRRTRSVLALVVLLVLVIVADVGSARAAGPRSPFGIKGGVREQAGQAVARLDFSVPADHVLYADRLRFETGDGSELVPAQLTSPTVSIDKASGTEKRLFLTSFAAELSLGQPRLTNFVVRLQGCSNSACYFPEARTFRVGADGVIVEILPPEEPEATDGAEEAAASASVVGAGAGAQSGDWMAAVGQFKVVGRTTGYLAPTAFTSFLERARLGKADEEDPLTRFKGMGLLASLCLIVLGGAGLNLTPCVLPLIPINLAIIGAGASARSRRQGFGYGAIYGSGMAMVYGLLGLFVVLTGSKFGALNSSIGFNLGIAVVFVVLALGMFDLVQIDLSRFGDRLKQRDPSGTGPSRSRWLVAFSFGAVAALLAGACVAPVVISVLLLATKLYAQGIVVALFLPFLLGLGMGLPWPFAGASLSFLPKPGRWMTWVKYGFGVLILGFACYYAHLGYSLYRSQNAASSLAGSPVGHIVPAEGANEALAKALAQARAAGRPVFIDFQASWCKNCLAMEEAVFPRPEVQKALQDFVVIKYPAERPNEPAARRILDRFGVMGLPTYVVLAPQP